MNENGNNNFREQFVLRVRKESELDKVMTALQESRKPLTDLELVEAGGLQRSGWLIRTISGMFDNLNIDVPRGDKDLHHTMSYVDLFPGKPVPVSIDVREVTKTESLADTQVYEDDSILEAPLSWPQAPPMVESLGDKFRQPSWFNTMKAMVKAGSHISLAGPPGVGKDTCVQELAAREGKILVTIGGDAGFRRRDLVGGLQISHGRSFFEVAEYAAAAINGWWVLLTEVNAADADALMFINSQLAAPYIVSINGKAYPVHPNFRLFVSYNPGLVGTKPLPQAFKDRFFSIKVPFFSKSQMWNVLCAHGAPEVVWLEDIVNCGLALWDAHERGQLRYQVTTRRLMDAVTLLKIGEVNDVVSALDTAVIASIDSPVEAKVAKQVINSMTFASTLEASEKEI